MCVFLNNAVLPKPGFSELSKPDNTVEHCFNYERTDIWISIKPTLSFEMIIRIGYSLKDQLYQKHGMDKQTEQKLHYTGGIFLL